MTFFHLIVLFWNRLSLWIDAVSTFKRLTIQSAYERMTGLVYFSGHKHIKAGRTNLAMKSSAIAKVAASTHGTLYWIRFFV